MNKRIGILTINVNLMNYGNRLQNYALQEVLRKLGHDALTVDYTPSYPSSSFSYSTSVQKKSSRFFPLRMIPGKAVRLIVRFMNRYAYRRKIESFNDFVRNKIKWTNEKYGFDSDFSALNEEFDYMIAGSDQVWNPYWEGTQPVYFMEFVPPEKRIAYAASFGVSEIPDDMRERYRAYMKQIPRISCREDTGCDIVENLTGRRPEHVLDPVFLLSKDEWSAMEKEPSRSYSFGSSYVLVYFLGGISESANERIKSLKNAVYLDRREKFNPIFASPEEFLFLVNHAEMIITDSFHGCVFSLIFNKPFAYFDREVSGGNRDMSSRLSSLSRLIQCRISEHGITSYDYPAINQILAREKIKSMNFLESSLR